MPTHEELHNAGIAEDDTPAPRVPGRQQVFKPPQPRPKAEPQVLVREVVPEGAIVPVDGGVVLDERFYPTIGAQFDEMMESDWTVIGVRLFGFHRALQWIIGDWIVYGLDNFHLTIEDIAERFHRDPHTLETYAWVCRNLPFSLRQNSLYFGHHALVAGQKKDTEKTRWLNDAIANNWSVAQMREAMKKKRRPALPSSQHQQNVKRSLEKLGKVDVGRASALDITKSQELLVHIEVARRHLDDLERAVRNAKNI